jgi:hypothetical protein
MEMAEWLDSRRSLRHFGRLHLTILEIEGVLFNILLYCRFARYEIKSLILRKALV